MSLDKQTVGIFTTDANLIIRSWDNWLAEATGIVPARARGESLLALFPEFEQRRITARFERVLTEGIVEVLAPSFHHFLIPCPPVAPSRHFEHMQQHVTIAPLRENETIIGTIVTIEDVTARLDRERELAEQLASQNEDERLRALQTLSEEETPTGTETLIESLGDMSWWVRKTAVDGLARQAGGEEINLLLRALRDEHRNPGVLNSALQVLALSGIDAIEPLVELLNDANDDLRIYAAQALGDQHNARAVQPLIRALEDENVNVRYHAIESLGKLRAPEAVDALATLAESRDFFLAFPALDALTAIGDSRIAPRLVKLLEDEMLSSPATDALGRLGDQEVVAPLITLLNKPGAPVQSIAQALATLYDRYEKSLREGSYIGDLARARIEPTGIQNLIQAIDQTSGHNLRPLALVLGWLEGEAVERALVCLLGQENARKEVIEALVRYGERVTKLLADQLQAEDSETRKAAIIALGRIGDANAVPAIVAALDEDQELTVLIAGALGKIGDRRAFESLLELLGHPDAAVRQASIAAINSLGHPEMAARACRLLTDQNPHIRESAVKIAGYFGYPECTDLLLERCGDEVESIRRAAVEHLPYLEDERATAILVEALQHGTPAVRAAAAGAFAHVERAIAYPYLKAALSDSHSWVRYFAIRSIGQHQYNESLETLLQLAETDVASQVRIAAVDALGKLGGARAVTVLTEIIESADKNLAQAALKSLGQIRHPDARTVLLETLRTAALEHRIEAINALGNSGGNEAVQQLQWVAATDSDRRVTETAIAALAKLATPEAIAALVDLTAEANYREVVVEALSHLGEQKAHLVGRGLKHLQPSVRRAVVDALGRMKHPLASEQLNMALEDEDAGVRLATVNALNYLGNRVAERRLLNLMSQDPDAAVRRAAKNALRH